MTHPRRGFALIAAIGVIVVLGLIVAGLSDSVLAQRQVTRHWRGEADQRLAVTGAMRALESALDAGEDSPAIELVWGESSVLASVRELAEEDPIYEHPALAHRRGDRLAKVEIDGEVELILLRSGGQTTHHRLPADLITEREGTP